MNYPAQLLKSLWIDRRLILELAANDFKTRYAGSYFGLVWAFVQPIMTILIFWYVFEVGLRAARMQEVPFILWFSAGLIPWFFFSEALPNATGCFLEYSYLVKKVLFRISILPLIKILSSFFIHTIFVLLLLIFFAFYGYFPGWITLQILYYVLCSLVLVISLSFFTASVLPFFRDISQIIVVLLQFGMWMTPIMWPYTMVAEELRWLFYLNPMFYIVEGFRATLIGQTWFWQDSVGLACFWGITASLFVLGCVTFWKLKPHFADVL